MKDLSESSAFKQGISLNITILKLVRDLRLEYRFFFFASTTEEICLSHFSTTPVRNILERTFSD